MIHIQNHHDSTGRTEKAASFISKQFVSFFYIMGIITSNYYIYRILWKYMFYMYSKKMFL